MLRLKNCNRIYDYSIFTDASSADTQTYESQLSRIHGWSKIKQGYRKAPIPHQQQVLVKSLRYIVTRTGAKHTELGRTRSLIEKLAI